MSHRPAVAVDFDGTVAQYESWEGEGVVGKPMHGAIEFLKALDFLGFDVWIFSARAASTEGRHAIRDWVIEHGAASVVKGITSEKLYKFYRFVDDRAIAFKGDYNEVIQQLLGK